MHFHHVSLLLRDSITARGCTGVTLKGSYDAVSSCFSLRGVTSWLCIDKIPEVAKTKVSNPRRYSLLKVKTPYLNTPPHVYVTVWEDLQNTAQMCIKERGRTFILAVVLLVPPAPCPGDAVFRCERETTLCFQKTTQLEISVKLYLQHCNRTVQP